MGDDDRVPESAYVDLLARIRSLEFENRKWKAHAAKMEKTARAFQRNERGLLAEINSLEVAANEWKIRANSAERSLIGFNPVQESSYQTKRNWW